MAKETEKWLQFAGQIITALDDTIFNKDSEHYISVNENELTEFIHALANKAPSLVYKQITGDSTDDLGFNHIANRLCVQYRKEKKVVTKTTDELKDGLVSDKPATNG